jgi:hypothetical protein
MSVRNFKRFGLSDVLQLGQPRSIPVWKKFPPDEFLFSFVPL